ncbi:MAG: winged helix-turn-helix domain-containing protein [Proteobacteria bacterium]|nr:winged helix-turn-helix domain-containing protein [Pseudomonadota bacterium]
MPIQRGQLEILVDLNEIRGPAGHQRLEPQAMIVLELLASAPGKVWSREQLLDSAWQGRVVSDATLTGVVSRLRRVVKAVGADGVRIETRSKRGYVLVESLAAVEKVQRPWAVRGYAAAIIGIALILLVLSARLLPGKTTIHGDHLGDYVLLTFSIDTPWGETVEPIILTEQGHPGEIQMFDDQPLIIKVLPQDRGGSDVHLRFELSGISHWGTFEHVVSYGEETRLQMPVDDSGKQYDLRFTAERRSQLPDFALMQKR